MLVGNTMNSFLRPYCCLLLRTKDVIASLDHQTRSSASCVAYRHLRRLFPSRTSCSSCCLQHSQLLHSPYQWRCCRAMLVQRLLLGLQHGWESCLHSMEPEIQTVTMSMANKESSESAHTLLKRVELLEKTLSCSFTRVLRRPAPPNALPLIVPVAAVLPPPLTVAPLI